MTTKLNINWILRYTSRAVYHLLSAMSCDADKLSEVMTPQDLVTPQHMYDLLNKYDPEGKLVSTFIGTSPYGEVVQVPTIWCMRSLVVFLSADSNYSRFAWHIHPSHTISTFDDPVQIHTVQACYQIFYHFVSLGF
jgi:hypothetical protein